MSSIVVAGSTAFVVVRSSTVQVSVRKRNHTRYMGRESLFVHVHRFVSVNFEFFVRCSAVVRRTNAMMKDIEKKNVIAKRKP